jgi:L-ascorbate metabolism protein UlaG (beta-lactamase superfamily)
LTTNGSPLDRLRDLDVPDGAIGMSWLGQAGFILRASGGGTVLLDPFLAPYEGREYESGLAPGAARDVDLVLCTHEHVDHFDAASAPAIAAASPGAVFVVPTPIVDMVTEVGIAAERVVGLQPGETLGIAGLTIGAVPALHGVTTEDAYTFGEAMSDGLIRFLGYVIDAGPVRVYHAGDTIHYEGMEDRLRHLAIDLALLPINGRDHEREALGIIGNLSAREAAWLATEIHAATVVPMHHDLFAKNRGYPAHLVESVERDHPGVSVLVPQRERPFVWSSGRPR